MTEKPFHIQRAAELADRLDADNQLWSAVRFDNQSHPWYGLLLGEIVPLIGFDAIEYVTSKIEFDEPRLGILIIVFTAENVICSSKESVESPSMTTIFSRSKLRGMEGHGAMSPFDNEFGSRWPGAYKVALNYEDGFDPIDLPLGTRSVARSLILAEFLPSLIADLSR